MYPTKMVKNKSIANDLSREGKLQAMIFPGRKEFRKLKICIFEVPNAAWAWLPTGRRNFYPSALPGRCFSVASSLASTVLEWACLAFSNGGTRVNFLKIALSLSLLPLTARAEAPAFDLQKYQQVIATAVQKGQSMPVPPYELRSLARGLPSNQSEPHQAEYFGAEGSLDSQGRYGVTRVSVVSEDWRKDSKGNWEIEQRIWFASPTGDLLWVAHDILNEAADGTYLGETDFPVGAVTDSSEINRWRAKAAEWYGFQP